MTDEDERAELLARIERTRPGASMMRLLPDETSETLRSIKMLGESQTARFEAAGFVDEGVPGRCGPMTTTSPNALAADRNDRVERIESLSAGDWPLLRHASMQDLRRT